MFYLKYWITNISSIGVISLPLCIILKRKKNANVNESEPLTFTNIEKSNESICFTKPLFKH